MCVYLVVYREGFGKGIHGVYRHCDFAKEIARELCESGEEAWVEQHDVRDTKSC